jgi:RNA polymerase sigma-70 factor (ECF subfamily)
MGKQPNAAGVPTEDDLIARARQGDGFAWNKLIDPYRSVVEQRIRKLCQENRDLFPEGDEDSLVQEVLLRAFRGLANFRGDSAFSMWLFRIVSNTFLEEKRRRLREKLRVVSYEQLVERGWERRGGVNPEEVYLKKEQAEIVRGAVSRLPDHLSVVVVLYYFQDKSTDEIAQILEIPRNTVISRLSAARKKLREDPEMVEYFGGETAAEGAVPEGAAESEVESVTPSGAPVVDEKDSDDKRGEHHERTN